MYSVQLTPSARRQIAALPDAVYAAVAEFLDGDLRTNPRRVGKPLSDEMKGMYSARRGTYRIIYKILDEQVLVQVVRIRHRRDAYRAQ